VKVPDGLGRDILGRLIAGVRISFASIASKEKNLK
jgi:hypothetical protein